MQTTEWKNHTGLLASRFDTGQMRDSRRDDLILEEGVEVAGTEKNTAVVFAGAASTNSPYLVVDGQLGTRIQRDPPTDTPLDCTAGGQRSHQRYKHCCWNCHMRGGCSLAAGVTE
jgi:hypothetical protein